MSEPETTDARRASLRRHACVVIIGGGAAGTSVAYHLTKAGWRDVVLIERGTLGCGTTWHSAGDIPLMKPTGLISLVRYGADLYSKLEAETGQSVGWNNCGYVKVARTRARLEDYKRSVAIFNALGGAAEVVAPKKVREIWPLAAVDDLVGAVTEPGSGRVDPAGLVMAYAKGAQSRGAVIVENCRVTGFKTSQRRVTGVETSLGVIACDVVVNCAGLWARGIGTLAGVNVPLHATEHFYMLTKPITGIHRGLPILNDLDGNIYMREDVGGLLVGCFEPGAKPLPVSRIPDPFSFGRLEEDWDHVEPYLGEAMLRVPALKSAGVRMLMNGPESFTPDGNLLIGEAPELGGFYVLAGFNSGGVAMSAGMGRTLTEWIIDAAPATDMTRYDIRRFGEVHNNTAWLGVRVSEIVGRHMAVPVPGKDYATGRPQRLSPFYHEMAVRGAQFGSLMGWERPLWFGSKEQSVENPFAQPWSLPFAAEEHRVAREGVALFDLSSFGKLLISGADAEAAAQGIFANNVGVDPGRAVYTPMLNEQAGIESDLTVIRLDEESFLVVTGAAQTTRDLDWIRHHIDPSLRATVVDQSSAFGVLGLMGPFSREVLAKATDCDLSNEAFPFRAARRISIGGARVLAVRISYAGELGWELYVPPDMGHEVFNSIWEAGLPFDIRCAGYDALGSLRMEKAYRSWGRDLSGHLTPIETGMLGSVDLSKDFIGKAALLAAKDARPNRRLVQFAVDCGDGWLWGDEPVYRNGAYAGLVTSAAFGHRVGKMLCFALLLGDTDRGTFEINITGRRCPAVRVLRALYDPVGRRLRS